MARLLENAGHGGRNMLTIIPPEFWAWAWAIVLAYAPHLVHYR